MIAWNGTAWSSIHDSADFDFNCLWGDAPDHLWAAGTKGTIQEYNGSGWKAPDLQGLETVTWASVWGSSQAVLFVSPIITLIHGGTKWEQYEGAMFNPVGLFGSDPSNLWTVSLNTGTAHGDGSTWTQMQTPSTTQLRSIWVGPDKTWAVGDWGTILNRTVVPSNGDAS